MKIQNGKMLVTSEEFQDLKDRNMIVKSGSEDLCLYHGYAHKLVITPDPEKTINPIK